MIDDLSAVVLVMYFECFALLRNDCHSDACELSSTDRSHGIHGNRGTDRTVVHTS